MSQDALGDSKLAQELGNHAAAYSLYHFDLLLENWEPFYVQMLWSIEKENQTSDDSKKNKKNKIQSKKNKVNIHK